MNSVSATAFHHGRELREDQLHPPQETCPICGCRSGRRTVVRIQKNPAVDFLRCPTCHGISASRMPTDDALADYYANYYDRSAIELVTFPKPERLARLIADRLPASAAAGVVRVLDFGGGDGTIALRVAERLIARGAGGVDILVVDYVQDTPVVPPQNVTLRFAPRLDDVDGRFGVIIASAILEHIPAFRASFDRLLGLAAPGALFYARTPYMTPFARWIPVDLTYPAHVHDLGGRFWTWIAANSASGVTVLKNGPSITETVLSSHPARTILADTLKAPARLLAAMGAPPCWPYYGGWQVLWRLAGHDAPSSEAGSE